MKLINCETHNGKFHVDLIRLLDESNIGDWVIDLIKRGLRVKATRVMLGKQQVFNEDSLR